MSAAERARLVAILGLLGSNHDGERAAAALQAEAFRKRHGLTWEQLLSGQTVYVDREVVVETAVPVDRIIYRWPLLWRLELIKGGAVDRAVGVALGSIPIIIVLAAYASKIRQALGY